MKKNIIWLLICLLLPPIAGWAYVTLQSYNTGEVLTAAKLNANQNALNIGLDDLRAEYRDSLKNILSAIGDSINARNRTIILLPLSEAAGDSFYPGDSLTVSISTDSPIGDAASLYVQSATSVIEKVKLFWDYELPNSLSSLDSVRFGVWTERTNGADFASLYVRDDSTRYSYKAATDSTGKAYSSTARTLKVYSIAVNNTVVEGRFRVELVLQLTNSDSMFVSPIELVVNNR